MPGDDSFWRGPSTRYWPTVDQRALLLVALGDRERALARWRVGRRLLLLPRPDPAALWLEPMLWPVVRAIAPDDPLSAELAAAYETSAALHARYRGHVAPLLRALERDAIPTALLKGAAIAPRFYGDAARRPMSDVDVLVPRDCVVAALAIVGEAGWRAHVPVTARMLAISHAAHFEDDDGCQLDLHWRPLFEPGPDPDERALWARNEPIDSDDVRSSTLSPTDALLHVCVHGTRWTRTSGIRWASDALLITQRASIDWDLLLREARDRQLVIRLRWTLSYLRTALGARVPETVIAAIAESPRTLLERVEHAVTSRPPNGPLSTAGILASRFVRTIPRHERRAATWRGFPDFVAAVWDLPSARALPGAISERTARIVAARRQRNDPAEEERVVDAAELGERDPERNDRSGPMCGQSSSKLAGSSAEVLSCS